MKIEELVARSFAARTAAHMEHLKTLSYARHNALGEFYSAVGEAADAVVEFYIAAFSKDLGDLPAIPAPTDPLAPWLRGELEWLEENLEALSQGSESLSNKIQELIACFARVLFFLRFK